MHRSRRSENLNNLGTRTPSAPNLQAPSTSGNVFLANITRIVSGSKSQTDTQDETVHGSMENLYHPVNYRSTSRSRKSRTRASKKRIAQSPEVTPRLGSRSGTSVAAGAAAIVPIDLYRNKPNNATLAVPSLMDENQMLYHALDEERKKILLRKAACSFLHGAVRKQTERIAVLGAKVKGKTQESAARLILHNLLLNAFRKRERELEVLMKENVELHKIVENLNLQIRVVRHLQVTEKQRGVEKEHELTSVKNKLTQMKDLLDASQAQLATVEEESRRAHLERHKFEEEACRVREEMKTTQEQFEYLSASLELEKNRSVKYETDSLNQKRMIADLKKHVDDLTKQSTQWQERARSFESTNWELTLKLQDKDRELKGVQAACKTLNQELFDGKQQKQLLKQQNEELQSQIRTCVKDSGKLKKSITILKLELDEKLSQNNELEESIKKIKNDYTKVRGELMQFKLRNLKKRRVWGNFFVLLVSPIEAFRYIFLSTSNQQTTRRQNQESQGCKELRLEDITE